MFCKLKFKISKYIQVCSPYYKEINESDTFHALNILNFKTTESIVTKHIIDNDYNTLYLVNCITFI